MSKSKFSIIVCDPPYPFKDKLQQSDVKRGAADNYRVMAISDIKQMPVRDISDPSGAILCLWVPSSLLQDGLDIMKAWGFKHKQTYIWIKQKKQESIDLDFEKTVKKIVKAVEAGMPLSVVLSNHQLQLNQTLAFGMGHLFRQSHEVCLIGINNNKIYKKLKNRSRRSVSFAENLKHSAKPEALQDALEVMFPNSPNRLELFARRQRVGWVCLGNEIDNKDIRDAIAELK